MPDGRDVPPKNFGRFIPCRGGGTATTYYTDMHDVDESIATISAQGGYWNFGDSVGVAQRHMFDYSSNMRDIVASRLIYLS